MSSNCLKNERFTTCFIYFCWNKNYKKEAGNDKQLDYEFKAGDNKKYKIDGNWDSAVYAKRSAKQLPIRYYLVFWKDYLKRKTTWEPILAIQHF